MQTLVQLDLLERRHASEDLEAAIGDLSEARVVRAQLQATDMLRRDVRRLAAVHTRQTFELLATTDVAEAAIGHIDRRQLAQRREVGQRGERLVTDLLATHTKGAK